MEKQNNVNANDNISVKKCKKYTNKYGTCFVDCGNTKHHHIFSFPLPVFSEDIKYCMYCGAKIQEGNPKYELIKWEYGADV